MRAVELTLRSNGSKQFSLRQESAIIRDPHEITNLLAGGQLDGISKPEIVKNENMCNHCL